jgi:hypothetical protein
MKLCENLYVSHCVLPTLHRKLLECRLVKAQFIIVLHLQYVCVNLQCICKGKRA